MPTIDINARTVAKAIADAKPGAKQSEISDSRARGLKLRIGAEGASWQYRYERLGKGIRFDLGSVYDWSLVEARELAADAAAHRRQGGTVDAAWLEGQLVKRGRKAEILVPVKSWDWVTARDDYLADVQRVNKPRTWKDYKARLTNTPELARFVGRDVATITLSEASRAVADIHARGVEPHAEHLAANISAFFSWLAKPARRDLTGVEPGRMLGLEAPARTMRVTVKKKYAPPMVEIGRLMGIARSGALHERVGLAIEHLVFSVQRVTYVVHAEIDAMEYAADQTEGLWIMDPFNRKTAMKRDDTTNHVVPLPGPAWRVVTRAMDLAGDKATRLFPGLRPRREGDVVDALAESTVQHTMSYMPGVVATPHDVRRSFSHHAQSHFRWGLAGTKSILDHNEGHTTDDVTVRNYLHSGEGEKWEIMRKWCAWVEEATAAAIEFDKRLLDAEWLRDHIDRKRREHKSGKRAGVSLAKHAA